MALDQNGLYLAPKFQAIGASWKKYMTVCTALALACILAFPGAVDPSLKADFSKRYICMVTFYTPSSDETDSTPYITASGARVRLGICAISRDLEKLGFTFGRSIYVKGLGSFEIQDRMHRRWKNRIDILVMSKRQARRFGKIEKAVCFFLNQQHYLPHKFKHLSQEIETLKH